MLEGFWSRLEEVTTPMKRAWDNRPKFVRGMLNSDSPRPEVIKEPYFVMGPKALDDVEVPPSTTKLSAPTSDLTKAVANQVAITNVTGARSVRKDALGRVGRRVTGGVGFNAVVEAANSKWNKSSPLTKVGLQALGTFLSSSAALATGSIMIGIAEANEKKEAAMQRKVREAFWARDKEDEPYGGIKYKDPTGKKERPQSVGAAPDQRIKSEYGISRLDEFTRFIGQAKGGSIKGTNFFVSSGAREADLLLAQSNSELILSPGVPASTKEFIYKEQVKEWESTGRVTTNRNEQTSGFAPERHYLYQIGSWEYAQRFPDKVMLYEKDNKKTLLHTKIYLANRPDGTTVGRVDTAPMATYNLASFGVSQTAAIGIGAVTGTGVGYFTKGKVGGIAGLAFGAIVGWGLSQMNLGAMGVGQEDWFYQTSYQPIVKELEGLYQSIKEGSKPESGRYLKVSGPGEKGIMSALLEDIKKARGDILVHSASIELNEFRSSLGTEAEGSVRGVINALIEKSKQGQKVVVSVGMTSRSIPVIHELAAAGVDVRFSSKIGGTGLDADSPLIHPLTLHAVPTIAGAGLGYLMGGKVGAVVGGLSGLALGAGANYVASKLKAFAGNLHHNLFIFKDVEGEDVSYIGSKRLTPEYESSEVLLRLTSRDDPAFIQYAKEKQLQTLNVSIQDLPAHPSLAKWRSAALGGFLSSKVGPAIGEALSDGAILAPTQMGASYFYARALHNNLMRQAGNYDLIVTNEDASVGTALYHSGYLARHRVPALKTPHIVREFDKELTSSGLGARLNEFLMPLGVGRVYKDEVGAIPSLFGAVGKMLDFGWLSTYGTPYTPIAHKSEGYQQSGEGFFERTFTWGSNLVLSSAKAVAFFLLVSEPLNILFGEMVKGQAQGSLNQALTPENFNTRRAQIDRMVAVGLDVPGADATEYRRNLSLQIYLQQSEVRQYNTAYTEAREALRAYTEGSGAHRPKVIEELRQRITETKGQLAEVRGKGVGSFFSTSNFSPSIYHLNTVFLRERAAFLVGNVMEPFLINVVNPFKVGSEADAQYRQTIRSLVDEIRTPAYLKYGKGLTNAEIDEVETFLKAKAVVEGKMTGMSATAAEALVKAKEADVDRLLAKGGFEITNVGAERSSNIARALQHALDVTPLNPFQWGMFGRQSARGGALSTAEFLVMGDLFSFQEASESVTHMLFGKHGLQGRLARYANAFKPKDVNQISKGAVLDQLQALWTMSTTGVKEIALDIQRGLELNAQLSSSQRAFHHMEKVLLERGSISKGAGDTVQKSALEFAERQLVKAGIQPTDMRYIPKKAALVEEYIGKFSDFRVREVLDITDETVSLAMQSRAQVQLTAESAMQASLKGLDSAHQYASELKVHSLIGQGEAKARSLSKLSPGLGGDASSAITKSKFGTAILTTLVAGLVVDQIFKSTQGVSLVTSLLTSLQMGKDETRTNVNYGDARLLGTVLGIPGDLAISVGIVLPLSILTAKAVEGNQVDTYGFKISSKGLLGEYSVDDLKAMPISAPSSRLLGTPLEPDADGFVKGVRRVSENLFDVMVEGKAGRYAIEGMELSGEYFTTAIRAKSQDVWRRAFVNWGVGTLAVMGAIKLAASLFSSSRALTAAIHTEGQGTLDPLAGTILGGGLAFAGAKLTGRRAFPVMLLGALGGGVGGLFTQFLKVGRPGVTADAQGATLVSELNEYQRLVLEAGKTDRASRLELMGAFYAQGLSQVAKVLEEEGKGKSNTVVAKQITLPFLHFFLAETTKGALYDAKGKLVHQGTKYYSFGIQGPVATGTSLVFPMPFKIKTSKEKGIGIALNEDYDIGDLFADAAGAGTLAYGSVAIAGGIATLSTQIANRVYTRGDIVGTGVIKAVEKLTDIGLTGVAHAGSLGLDIGVNLTLGDYRIAHEASKRGTKSARFLRGMFWATLLSQVGGAVGGAVMPEGEDALRGIYIGQWVGAGVGVGLAFTLTPSRVQSVGGLLKGALDKLPTGARRLGVATLMASAWAYFQTDSEFGSTIGMDEDPIQRLVTIGLYGTTGALTYGLMAGVGREVGDSVKGYLDIRKELETATGLRKAYLTRRIGSFENEVNAVLDMGRVLGPKLDTLASKRLQAVISNITKLDPAVRAASLAGSEVSDIVKYGRGIGVSQAFMTSTITTRRLLRVGMAAATLHTVGYVLAHIVPDFVQKAYDTLDHVKGPGLQQIAGGFADYLRLLTRTDYKLDTSLYIANVQRGGGAPQLMRYRKLRDAQANPLREVTKSWEDINKLLVVDDPNVFVSLFNITGFTLSPGEKGSRIRQYFQVQGPGADVSTAAYTMAATYLFRQAVSGDSELYFLTTTAVREMNERMRVGERPTQGTLRRVALRLLNTTAQLAPTKRPRKFSRPSDGELESAGKDPLLMEILSVRDREVRTLAYQPIESLVGRMMIGRMNPASPTLDTNLLNFLIGGLKSAHEKLYSDPFGLAIRDVSITGLGIFAGGGVKESAMSSASEWIDESSVLPEKKPLGGAGPIQAIMGTLPGPIGFMATFLTAAAGGLYLLASLGSYATRKEETLLEGVVKSYFEKEWFPINPKGRAAFQVRYMNDAIGTKFWASGRQLPVLYKGNYYLGVNPQAFQELIDNQTGVSKWESFYQSFKGLQADLEGVLQGSKLARPGNLYERMVDKQFIEGVVSQAQTWTVEGKSVLDMTQGKGLILNREGFIAGLTEELAKPFDELVTGYFQVLEQADLGTGRAGAFLRLATGDSTIDTLGALRDWAHLHHVAEANLYGSGSKTIVDVFHSKTRGLIQQVLEREIRNGGVLKIFDGDVLRLERALQYGGGDLDEVVRYLIIKVQGELIIKDSPLELMRHSFGGIVKPVDVTIFNRIEDSIRQITQSGGTIAPVIKKKASSLSGSWRSKSISTSPSLATETIKKAEEIGKVRRGVDLASTTKAVGKGASVLLNIATTAIDVLEAVDIFGSYSRVAESYADDSFSEGERIRLASEAGMVTVRSVLALAGVGLTVKMAPVLFGGLLKMAAAGLTAVGAVLTGISLPAIAVAAGAAVLAGGLLWGLDKVTDGVVGNTVKGAVGALWSGTKKVGGWVWEGTKTVFSAIGKGLDWVGDNVVGGGIRLLGSGGGRIGSGLIGAAGGLLGATVIGVSLFVGGAIALPALGVVALGGALLGSVLGAAAPGIVESIFTTITRMVSNATAATPLGPNVFTTLPGQWIHERFKPMPESPFFLGTAQQALENEWAKQLRGFRDHTGQTTLRNFIDPFMNSFNSYRLASESGYTIKPGVVIDSYLQSELLIRAQYYNQSAIGRGVWKSMYRDAINKRDINDGLWAEEQYAAQALAETLKAARDKRLQKSTPISKRGSNINAQMMAMVAPALNEIVRGITERRVTAKVKVKAPTNVNLALHQGASNKYIPTENEVIVTGPSQISVRKKVREDAPLWEGRHNPQVELNTCHSAYA